MIIKQFVSLLAIMQNNNNTLPLSTSVATSGAAKNNIPTNSASTNTNTNTNAVKTVNFVLGLKQVTSHIVKHNTAITEEEKLFVAATTNPMNPNSAQYTAGNTNSNTNRFSNIPSYPTGSNNQYENVNNNYSFAGITTGRAAPQYLYSQQSNNQSQYPYQNYIPEILSDNDIKLILIAPDTEQSVELDKQILKLVTACKNYKMNQSTVQLQSTNFE